MNRLRKRATFINFTRLARPIPKMTIAPWYNVCRNVVRTRSFGLAGRKILSRLTEHSANRQRILHWCESNAQDFVGFATARNPVLTRKSLEVGRDIEERWRANVAARGATMGGSGHCPLLYFITRSLRATTVVETGVAAGCSSQAILLALRDNGGGRLFSSDFPYLRLKEPHQYVGCMVDNDLKENWRLLIDGDRRNLPKIRAEVRHIDLFHYDSDKSRAGRSFALKALAPRLSSNSAVIFDDVQNNSHFMDLIRVTASPYKVFRFEGKFVGLLEGWQPTPAPG
jgi:predicted O-methyltransferase YrrM